MSERKVFHDSVMDLPDQPGLTPHGLMVNAARPVDPKETLTIHFAVSLPKSSQDQLEDIVARGETISVEDLNKNHAVDKADIEPLLAWLKNEHYEIDHVSDDGTGVFARASVEQIEKSLDVKMVRVTKDGITYTAAKNPPSLPAAVGKNVQAIIGLQPFRHAHKHSRRYFPKSGNRMQAFDNEELGLRPVPNIQNAPPYLVAEILAAYDADGLPVTGKGQTIAILIDTFPTDADLQGFWTRNNLPNSLAQIEKINVGGGVLPPPEGEETLDAEWASGIAPGAKVRIYASGSLQFSDLDRALDRILSDCASEPGMRQLSISLGLGETFMTKGELRTQHQKYLRLAAIGVNVFVSSGDAGSNPDSTGHGSNGPLQAEYPASDSCVVSVGGTTLVLAPNGDVQQEIGWADGGGGKSGFFKRPAWQKNAGIHSGSTRTVPDVSLTADPTDGAFLVLHGRGLQIGGTSWSAPVWAGFCALINEARLNAHKPALPFLNPLIYKMSGPHCFRDITSGSNGAFEAGPGYDLVCGLGVPNVKEMIRSLCQ